MFLFNILSWNKYLQILKKNGWIKLEYTVVLGLYIDNIWMCLNLKWNILSNIFMKYTALTLHLFVIVTKDLGEKNVQVLCKA